jgi:DNA primase
MNAREIAVALGNARREGHDWRCQCPVHNGYSLTLRDRCDTLLVKCWGGCTAHEILGALRSRGLLDGVGAPEREEVRRKRAAAAAKTEAERTKRKIARARSLYERGEPAAGTLVEAYLRSRGMTIPIPPVLRWLRWCPHRRGGHYPAMAASIVNLAGEETAIHKTFLLPDGSAKPNCRKRSSAKPAAR